MVLITDEYDPHEELCEIVRGWLIIIIIILMYWFQAQNMPISI